ncbi:MAG TPA: phage tail sheath C-terminal domain-containing protein [Blastocatellia bacterium]|nr:phage tail sheath C-terminal domain-containing protein [Blastocatellia bacterium]
MAEYLSPGVYVEEIDAGPKPIEGVSTSTAGAVGVTALGPTSGKPELVTSFTEFVRKFGGVLPDPPPDQMNSWVGNATEGGRWWQFPLAVKGFFDNGGQRLYVKRVFAGGGLPASAQTTSNSAVASSGSFQRGLVSEIEGDATAGANPASIKVRHLFGISAAGPGGAGPGSTVTLRNGETGQQIGGDFQVESYDPTTRRITLDAPLPPSTDLRAARGDVVVIHQPAAVTAPGLPLRVRAKARGMWGDDIFVRSRPVTGANLALLFDPVNGGPAARATIQSVTAAGVVTVAAAAAPPPESLAGFADGDHVLINGNEYAITSVDEAANTFEVVDFPPGTTWPAGTQVQRLRPAHDHGADVNEVRVWGASSLYNNAVLEFDNGRSKEILRVDSMSGDLVTLSGDLVNDYYEGSKIRVIEMEVNVQYRPNNTLAAEETFSNLRLVGRTTDPNYIVSRVNAASRLIELDDSNADLPTDLDALPIAPEGRWLKLGGGNDNYAALTPDDFVGIDGGSGLRTGIQALEDIDEISICVVPGVWSRTVHNALIQHCEILKDRFAIIDPRDNLDIEGVRTFREAFDTKYAAIYYPWVVVRDPLAKRDVRVAPSGHITGIYARVDVERGVHKAPANEVIRGITKIADDVVKREQDMLNPRNINVLRFFPGRGNRVWGARVLTSDSAWKYINVRRLFIFVEESIDEGTQWVVFEPNDEALWARVRASVTNFLTTVWRNGALQGTKPDEAFFVKCDRTTMTQDDIDNGRLICLIGIAPVKPAEFVIFRIQQKTLETTLS